MKKVISDQLLHILSERAMEFYKNPENLKEYERWIKNEKNTNSKPEERT